MNLFGLPALSRRRLSLVAPGSAASRLAVVPCLAATAAPWRSRRTAASRFLDNSRLGDSTVRVNHQLVPRRLWRQLSGAFLDAVLPPACCSCGEAAVVLCDPCRRNLVERSAGGCTRCGAIVLPGGRCSKDHGHLRGLSKLIAPLRFTGTGGRLVRRFKLDGDVAAGRWLARAMTDAYRISGMMGRPLVVGVPLHRMRKRRRGFDQADWLARRVASRLGMRRVGDALVRWRATTPQGDPRVRSRTENVRGAFVVREAEQIAGRSVLLVDDVFTSGATARSCARVLRDAGAVSVALLCACAS